MKMFKRITISALSVVATLGITVGSISPYRICSIK